MNLRLLCIPIFFVYSSLFSQLAPNFGDVDSHDYFITQLNNSKDSEFQRILGRYDNFINEHPQDIIAQVERCKFIGNAYFDEYEGYNLKYEETEACINQLFDLYPAHPQVLVYKAQNVYGEERLKILERAQEEIRENRTAWRDTEKAAINQMLGNYYWSDDNNWLALRHYLQAQSQNEELDLSIDIAQIYVEQEKKEAARDILLKNRKKDTLPWRINDKARMLLELGETNVALELFNEVQDKDSTIIDNAEMAKAMVNLNKHEIARDFLVKDTINEWTKTNNLRTLFDHDLNFSDARLALNSYRSLQSSDSYDDFLAIKRIRLFIKHPLLPWNFSELLHLLFLALSIAILIVLPYIWILPIFNLGLFLKSRTPPKIIVPKLNFNWGLKHFWLISFIYLLAQYLLSLIFYYEENMYVVFDVGYGYEEFEEDTLSMANSMMTYIVFMAVGTLAVLKKDVLHVLYRSNLTVWRSLGIGVSFVIFNVILIKVLRVFVDVEGLELSQMFFSATPEIAAIVKTYGFAAGMLAVAIVGPIYEEIIFRGVVLGSIEKHLGFITANILQAVLFAIVHFNFSLFVYYLFFGLITGYYTRRTGGLQTGIILHAVNNFFVLVLIYFFL